MPEAIAQFEAALKINPDLWEAHQLLGILLSGAPNRRSESLAHF
jgi:protein O-mannosyl-transferase